MDDEAAVRGFNRTIVEGMNCTCAEAADGAEAVARMEGGAFDLVLLDRDLPDADGYDLCRTLRDRSDDPTVKILVLLGSGTPDELAEALRRGADDYVVKPYQPRRLAAKVLHALRHKEAQDRAAFLAAPLREANAQLQDSLGAGETTCARHTGPSCSPWPAWANRATARRRATCTVCANTPSRSPPRPPGTRASGPAWSTTASAST